MSVEGSQIPINDLIDIEPNPQQQQYYATGKQSLEDVHTSLQEDLSIKQQLSQKNNRCGQSGDVTAIRVLEEGEKAQQYLTQTPSKESYDRCNRKNPFGSLQNSPNGGNTSPKRECRLASETQEGNTPSSMVDGSLELSKAKTVPPAIDSPADYGNQTLPVPVTQIIYKPPLPFRKGMSRETVNTALIGSESPRSGISPQLRPTMNFMAPMIRIRDRADDDENGDDSQKKLNIFESLRINVKGLSPTSSNDETGQTQQTEPDVQILQNQYTPVKQASFMQNEQLQVYPRCFGSRKVPEVTTQPFDAFAGPDDASVVSIRKHDMAVGTPSPPVVAQKIASPRLPYSRVTFIEQPRDRLIRKPYMPSSNKIKIKPIRKRLPLSPQIQLPAENLDITMRNVVASFNNVYNRTELKSQIREFGDNVGIEHQNRPFSQADNEYMPSLEQQPSRPKPMTTAHFGKRRRTEQPADLQWSCGNSQDSQETNLPESNVFFSMRDRRGTFSNDGSPADVSTASQFTKKKAKQQQPFSWGSGFNRKNNVIKERPIFRLKDKSVLQQLSEPKKQNRNFKKEGGIYSKPIPAKTIKHIMTKPQKQEGVIRPATFKFALPEGHSRGLPRRILQPQLQQVMLNSGSSVQNQLEIDQTILQYASKMGKVVDVKMPEGVGHPEDPDSYSIVICTPLGESERSEEVKVLKSQQVFRLPSDEQKQSQQSQQISEVNYMPQKNHQPTSTLHTLEHYSYAPAPQLSLTMHGRQPRNRSVSRSSTRYYRHPTQPNKDINKEVSFENTYLAQNCTLPRAHEEFQPIIHTERQQYRAKTYKTTYPGKRVPRKLTAIRGAAAPTH